MFDLHNMFFQRSAFFVSFLSLKRGFHIFNSLRKKMFLVSLEVRD